MYTAFYSARPSIRLCTQPSIEGAALSHLPLFAQFAEAITQRCSVKKVFLEISQNSQENTCVRLLNFVKFLRTPFLTEHLWWLLLNLVNFPIISD